MPTVCGANRFFLELSDVCTEAGAALGGLVVVSLGAELRRERQRQG